MISPDFLYIYQNNPKQLKNIISDRNVKEDLIVHMLLDKEAAQTRFVAEVSAPADPEVAAYIKKFSSSIANHLRFDETITDTHVRAYKQKAYESIQTNRSFDVLNSKASDYEEYSSMFISKMDRRIVSRDVLNFAKYHENSLNSLVSAYLLLNGKPFERDKGHAPLKPELGLLFKYGELPQELVSNAGTRVVTMLNYYSFRTHEQLKSDITTHVDHIMVTDRDQLNLITNFKVIPCKLTEVKSRAEELLWADVACLHHLGEQMKSINKYAYKIRLIVIDSQGYSTLVTFSEEKSLQYYKKLVETLQTDHMKSTLRHGYHNMYPGLVTPIKI